MRQQPTGRHGVSSRSGRHGQVGLLVVRARSHDQTPPNLVESHRALTETGAVRVRWDREQLIGGKPERLVSRSLRVLVWVRTSGTPELMEVLD